MTTVPKDLINFGVRRQIDIQRYSSKMAADVAELLGKAEAEVMDKIRARGDSDTWTARRLKALFAEIGDITFEAHNRAVKKLSLDMRDFGSHEAEVTAGLIASQVPASFSTVTPSPAQLAAIVDKEPIMVGPDRKVLLEEIFTDLAASKEKAIRGAVRLGQIEGETTEQIVRRLIGTRAAKYEDGILAKNRRGTTAMVRTIVNHVGNGAVQRMYAENGDLVKGWTFLATLDSRTTIQCASLSGTEWPIGQGPMPPRHVNCRSFSIPKLATFKDLGVDLEEMPVSTRASKDGQVRADISFDEWLKDQPVTVQRDILGATRQELFSNGMPLKQFSDNKGVVYSLTQLEHRHQALFEQVFGPNLK